MANPNPNKKGLKVPTSKEARKNGRKGGIKSGEVRKEKKLLSQIYAEFLAKKHDVQIKNEFDKYSSIELTGEELCARTINSVLQRSEACSVSMLKELREATEGSKMALTGPDGEALKTEGIKIVIVHPDPLKQIDDEHTTAG